jgi:sortase (surface protein transpeptidase)
MATHLKAIWTFFAIAMLLASILSALVSPATAQTDTNQGEDAPVDQTVVDPTATEMILEPTSTVAAEDNQSLQDEQPPQDQPADIPVTGTITVNYRLCPPEADPATADATTIASACTVTGEGTSFNLAGSTGDLGTQTTGPAPSGVTFANVLPDSVTLSQLMPPPGNIGVFCEGNTQYGNTKPYARAFSVAVASVALDVLEGETIECDWYASGGAATAATGTGTVIIRKRACPVGYDASAHDMYDMAAKCHDMPAAVPFSVFEAGGGYDGGVKNTSGPINDVQFQNVPNVPLWIYEEVPTGFGDPVAFCGVETALGADVSPTRYYAWGPGYIELDAPGEGNVVQCDWYNIPSSEGSSITIYKWKCDPGTVYGNADPDYYPTQCATEMPGVDFTLTDANGTQAFTSDTNGKQINDVVPTAQGTFTLTETIPDGYGDPVVYCQNNGEDPQPNQPTLVQSGGGIVTIQPSTTPFEYQCFWYNLPELPGTVTIHKWECPQGMTVDPTLQAHQAACTQPMDNVTFTLADSLGPRAKTTAGGMVEWMDAQIETFTVTEEVPTGYSVQPYVACDFESQNLLDISYLVTNNVLTVTLNHSGQKVICHWFNQYLGPGEVTIYKWTCPEVYDVNAWGADPKVDCTEATNGINFVLDQPGDIDLQTMTGDSIGGAVYFGGLTPGDYTVTEIVPDGIAEVFVLDCVGLNTGSVHPVPLSVGPTLAMKIAGGDKIRCDWYNVPQHSPEYGWLTVTKYNCTTATYVSDIDCEVFEGGKAFDLQLWNGSGWTSSQTGTTNTAGQLTWTNLNPGTYRVVEQGATPCKVTSTPADTNGNPVVNAQVGTTVKVYNCGQTPPPGGKMPTKYPNTGVEPAGSTQVAPATSILGALGLLGGASVSRRTFLRRSVIATAAVGTGSMVVANGLASQVIQPIGTAVSDPVIAPEGTPGADCLYPATPSAATPPDGTPVACARGAVPVNIAIEAIDVDASIEVLEIIGGEMQQPTGATDVAWYKESARLGEPGNVLLAGHLNYWGVPEGVFFALAQLKEGDAVELMGDDDASYRYIVQWSEDFPSDEEPPEEALGQTDEQVITMITCGGEWNAGRAEYDHRTLVRAIHESQYVPSSTPVA